jgi:multiple sugar transport system ATP-binding protein
MATVALEQVTKVYRDAFEAVHALDLDVAEGEFMVLVGPSGCGKTTVLRMVAGLEDITGGTLQIAGKVVNTLGAKERNIAMVFQTYALYPHMTVAQNIGFPLMVTKQPKGEIDEKVRHAANVLGITKLLDRMPDQLSGGQRQRVAMGRAIVRQPSVFLMDEPLSHLDATLRVHMRAEVSRIQRELGVSTMYVTHDQIEAMTMGDRVAVMRKGYLQQCDRPQALYDHPNNIFVAGFIGSPAMNLFRAVLGDGVTSVKLGSQIVDLPEAVAAAHRGLVRYVGREIVVGFRPEHLSMSVDDSQSLGGTRPPALEADVEQVEALGSELLVHFAIDARSVVSEEDEPGEDRRDISAGAGVARVDPRSPVNVFQRARLVPDTERMQFFDAKTGLAIWD